MTRLLSTSPSAPPQRIRRLSAQTLAWLGLGAWLTYSAACLVWWFLQDPLRFQMICRSLPT